MKKTRAGIVIPAHNAEMTLAETVRSVRQQSVSDWRMVIVNNGSTDGTGGLARELAAADCRIAVIDREDGGPSAARNTGFDSLQAEEVLFLDADDTIEASALSTLQTALERRPDCVAAYGLPRPMTFAGALSDISLREAWGANRVRVEGWRARRVPLHEPTTFASFVIWTHIQTPGQVLIRRAALERAGAWRRMPSEDWEMYLRLSLQGGFAFVPEFVTRKRATPNSLSSNKAWLGLAEPEIRRLLMSRQLPREIRTIATVGELHACLLRLSWAAESARRRAPGRSVRNLQQAGACLCRFAMRRMRRDGARDGGWPPAVRPEVTTDAL